MFEAIFILTVLFFSIVIHEIAHGSVALFLGDDTAKRAGRLTLNPISHIDPIGTIFLPLTLFILTFGKGPIFGWAKPVPVNHLNLRDQKWGMVKVSLAGPATNLLIAVFFSILANFNFPASMLEFFRIISIYNFAWAFFNLLPFYPLDGFHILSQVLPEKFSQFKIFLNQYGFLILLFIIFFGLSTIFYLSSFIFNLLSNLF
jgi:Zn-dependent protease